MQFCYLYMVGNSFPLPSLRCKLSSGFGRRYDICCVRIKAGTCRLGCIYKKQLLLDIFVNTLRYTYLCQHINSSLTAYLFSGSSLWLAIYAWWIYLIANSSVLFQNPHLLQSLKRTLRIREKLRPNLVSGLCSLRPELREEACNI